MQRLGTRPQVMEAVYKQKRSKEDFRKPVLIFFISANNAYFLFHLAFMKKYKHTHGIALSYQLHLVIKH